MSTPPTDNLLADIKVDLLQQQAKLPYLRAADHDHCTINAPTQEYKRPTNLKKIFLRGSIFSLSGAMLLGLFGYLNRRLAVTLLPEFEYAFFYSMFSLISIANVICMMGVINSAFFLIPDYRNQGLDREAQGVYAWVIRHSIIATITVTLLGALVIPFGGAFFAKYQVSMDSVWLLLLLPLPLALSLACTRMLTGMKAFFISNLFQSINVLIIFIALYLGLKYYALKTVIIAYALGAWITALGSIWWMWKYYRYSPFHTVTPQVRKRVHHMGIWLLIVGFGYESISDLGILLLAYLSTPQEVAIYNIALPIALIVRSLAVLSGVFSPFANELFRKGDYKIINRALHLTLLVTGCFMLMTFGVFFWYGELIIKLLFGSQYISAAGCTIILTEGVLLWNGAKFYSDIIASMQRERICAGITIAVTVLASILYTCLGRRYGAIGAAWTVVYVCGFWMGLNYFYLQLLLRRLSVNHLILPKFYYKDE